MALMGERSGKNVRPSPRGTILSHTGPPATANAMPPKKKAAGKKGGGKAAKPAYLTENEHCEPFRLFANDIVMTPLGIRCTVLGVKYAGSVEDRENARVWVRYPNGREAPIENPAEYSLGNGYVRGSGSDVLRREAERVEAERLKAEAVRLKAEREAAAKEAAIKAEEAAKEAKKKAKAEAKRLKEEAEAAARRRQRRGADDATRRLIKRD